MKKGFTLIELLAVIIVLAIIALIATPLVMNTIKNVRKGSAERNAQAYINKVDIMVEEERLKKNKVEDGIYLVNEEGNLCKEAETVECDNPYIVGVKGEKPAVGSKIAIEKGVVVKKVSNYPTEQTVVVTSDKQYMTTFNKEEKLVTTLIKVYNNGEAVYYDVDTGSTCDESQAVSTTGTNFGCMKFYAFNDSEGAIKVNLLLDHNTTAGIKWNASNTNTTGPDSAFLTQFAEDTTGWQAEAPAPYEDPAYHYTITYTTNARLITANEIANITDNTSWDSSLATFGFYFDSNKQTSSPTCEFNNTTRCSYGWLYDRTRSYCKTYGCLNDVVGENTYGYWTVSARATSTVTSGAWLVFYQGNLNHANYGVTDTRNGIRPVIEVLKSNL